MNALDVSFPVLCLLTSAFTFGIYAAAKFKNFEDFDKDPQMWRKLRPENKMIFWWVRYYGSYLPEFFRYPLYYCPVCMVSVYSIPLFIASSFDWYYYFLLVPVSAGINVLISENFNT